MSDKLQFVGAFGSGRVSETSDKLKFGGHFHRPFALLSNSPTVSRRLPCRRKDTEEGNRHMTNPQILSKIVDHIPVIWVEPENFTAPAHLVIWMDGLTGNKERMQPYLATLAASGFVAASFDAFQHGRSEEHTSELQSLRHLVCR